MATSQTTHVAILSFALTSILVLLLATASVYDAPTTSLRYPKHHLLDHRRPGEGRQLAGSRSGIMITGAGAGAQPPRRWPEMVGMDAEEAKKKILEEQPSLQVLVVPAGGMMTMDHNLRRVRIFKDGNEKVARVPQLG